MANELLAKSSPRRDQNVPWAATHTAEGPYDDDPADPQLDPGSARDLLAYFRRADVRASSHAIADDDVLLDDLIPYDRKSWTLRDGNDDSDNIELCGRAGWSRAAWLQHPGMLRNCAVWHARRAKARGRDRVVFIGTAGVRNRQAGAMGHVNYTEATGDGTHWDPGPGFPWDLVVAQANQILNGSNQEDDMFEQSDRDMLTTIKTRTEHLDVQGMQALARLDRAVPQVLATLQAAGVADASRDAAVLGAIAALPRSADVDEAALAAELAPLLAEHGVELDAATIVRAMRADLSAALAVTS